MTQVLYRFIDEDGQELGTTPYPIETLALIAAGTRAVGRSYLGPRDGDDAIRIDFVDATRLQGAGLLVPSAA